MPDTLRGVADVQSAALQSLYNLTDAQTEFSDPDRFTFMRFLRLTPGESYSRRKDHLVIRGSFESARPPRQLLQTFTHFLEAQGFEAKRGTLIDARIVEVLKQRN